MSLQYEVISFSKGNQRTIAEFEKRQMAIDYVAHLRKQYFFSRYSKYGVHSKTKQDILDETRRGLGFYKLYLKEAGDRVKLKACDIMLESLRDDTLDIATGDKENPEIAYNDTEIAGEVAQGEDPEDTPPDYEDVEDDEL